MTRRHNFVEAAATVLTLLATVNPRRELARDTTIEQRWEESPPTIRLQAQFPASFTDYWHREFVLEFRNKKFGLLRVGEYELVLRKLKE